MPGIEPTNIMPWAVFPQHYAMEAATYQFLALFPDLRESVSENHINVWFGILLLHILILHILILHNNSAYNAVKSLGPDYLRISACW